MDYWEHLTSVAFVPLQAWRTLALHYNSLDKSLHWGGHGAFERHYRRSITTRPRITLLYHESENECAVPAHSTVCVREKCIKVNSTAKRMLLVLFATHAMLALRSLLLSAMSEVGHNPSVASDVCKWPAFLRMLVFRIVVQQHSVPWHRDYARDSEQYAVAALHQLVLRLVYNHESACAEWTRGPSPLWLLYHVEYEHMHSSLIQLMHRKKQWQRRDAELGRASLEFCGKARVQTDYTRDDNSTPVQTNVHPYQLSAALYAVLSQVVHMIYTVQHELRSYGIYHDREHPCALCYSHWDMSTAPVHQVAHALYERLVMMLRSGSAMVNSTGLLSSSCGGSNSALRVCHSTCHWCVLLRTICLAVLRQVRIRALVTQRSTLAEDALVADNYACVALGMRSDSKYYASCGVPVDPSSDTSAQHMVVKRCTWYAAPVERMLRQALHCFQGAPLLLRQYHTLSWLKPLGPTTPKSLEYRIWRIRNRTARFVPMCDGGVVQTLVLYKALENLWMDCISTILPRVLCALQRYVCESLTCEQACKSQCTHQPRHYPENSASGQTETLSRITVKCITLACRYYEHHMNLGWSDAPLRIDAQNSEWYAQYQPTLVFYAALEACLTCATQPLNNEWLTSRAPFIGAAVRHRSQCQVIDALVDRRKNAQQYSQYHRRSLLQWWVVLYSDNTHNVDEDPQHCTLADLQYTCRVANSVCAKRHRSDSQQQPLPMSFSMVDDIEAERLVERGGHDSIACMTMVHSAHAATLWTAFSTAESASRHYVSAACPSLHAELLASIPTLPEPSLHYAVLCGTPEALQLLRELNATRISALQCASDVRCLPNTEQHVPMPGYMRFLYDLLLGDDTQLARAAQWLYTRLFYEPRSRRQTAKRNGDVLSTLCVQVGDPALRFVRLLPMLLQSVVPDPNGRAEILFQALVTPYRESGALRQDYLHRRTESKRQRTSDSPSISDDDSAQTYWTQSSQSSMDCQSAEGDEPTCAGSTKSNNGKDERVFNLRHCSLYSNILALLAPYHMRIGISHSVLQRVWHTLLDSRELWVTHYQLACAMIEWLRPLRACDYSRRAQGDEVALPMWYVWRVMRAAYVRWRAQEQQRQCPSQHGNYTSYRRQALAGVCDNGRWTNQFEFVDRTDDEGASSRPSKTPPALRLTRSPTATSWCSCRQCALVSSTRPLPAWIQQRSLEDMQCNPIPGFWRADDMPFQSEAKLMQTLNNVAYVPVEQYPNGPAIQSGLYCRNDSSSADSQDPLPPQYSVVYDPLCPVPPYPDSADDIERWKQYSFQPVRAKSVWNAEFMHLPSCSQLMPDMQPPHLLLYAFVCDPGVDSVLRGEVFSAVLAWSGFNRSEMRPARPPSTASASQPLEPFRTSADYANEWSTEQARQFCCIAQDTHFQEQHHVVLHATEDHHYNSALHWLSSGLAPLSLGQLLRNRLMPLDVIVHMAIAVDALAQLPYRASETPDMIHCLLEQRTQQGLASQLALCTSRATLTFEALSELYDPSIVHAALLNMRYKGQTLPLMWTTSPYERARATPIPHDDVLHCMRDWINPKASYAHDTMPVYDSPLNMRCGQETAIPTTQAALLRSQSECLSSFALCMPYAFELAVNQPVTLLHGDVHSMDRLESSLGRSSTVIQLDIASRMDDCTFQNSPYTGHANLTSPLRSPQADQSQQARLFHGPLPSVTQSREDTPNYQRIVETLMYAPSMIGRCLYESEL